MSIFQPKTCLVLLANAICSFGFEHDVFGIVNYREWVYETSARARAANQRGGFGCGCNEVQPPKHMCAECGVFNATALGNGKVKLIYKRIYLLSEQSAEIW